MKHNRLKGMILYRDLTEAEVAEKLGISKRAMADRMAGRVELNAGEIIQLVKILRLTPQEIDYIFGF